MPQLTVDEELQNLEQFDGHGEDQNFVLVGLVVRSPGFEEVLFVKREEGFERSARLDAGASSSTMNAP